ncbi:MAG: hypothetical protein SFT92_07385 [Rickettsiales bacterium]|nr:hypothetical protein [Rickettsiales bacterium]
MSQALAADAVQTIDFTRSFIDYQNSAERLGYAYSGRSQLTSALTIEHDDKRVHYYLGAATRAQDSFGDDRKSLFLSPNYEFYVIQGQGEMQFARVGSSAAGTAFTRKNSLATAHTITTSPALVRYQTKQHLPTIEAVSAAYKQGRPLQARVSYDEQGHRITLEFPIGFINASVDGKHIQIHTGPILVPTAPSITANNFDQLRRAYIVFNWLDRFQLLLEDEASGGVDYITPKRVDAATIQIFAGE